jgi:release factor glutamine methyltransferase
MSSIPSDRPADAAWTVGKIIDWTTAHLKKHGSETPRLDAEILLAKARRCPRIQLYVQYHELLTDDERTVMRDLVRRRAQSEPVAYLVGHREFFGLDFRVTPDVLIPRPETETLVLELLAAGRAHTSPRILDVGTGSGCIAIAAAVNLPAAAVTGIDISAPALEIARANASHHEVGGRVKYLEGDLFAPLAADDPFDIIVSNPPYVADGEMDSLPADIRRHEPPHALRAGPEGLDVITRLISGAKSHLAPGGALLIEISPEQAARVAGLIDEAGVYEKPRLIKDASGNERVVATRHTA